MKNLFKNLNPIYQIVILNIAGGIAINYIMTSDILNNSKVSLSIILGVTVSLIMINIYLKAFKSRQQENLDKMDNVFQQYFEKLQTYAKESHDELISQCKELEAQKEKLEQLQSVFPLRILKRYTVYSIVREAYEAFTDSEWVISGEYNNQIFACHIVRCDTQTLEELTGLVRATKTPDEIYALDQYEEIYPDGEELAL